LIFPFYFHDITTIISSCPEKPWELGSDAIASASSEISIDILDYWMYLWGIDRWKSMGISIGYIYGDMYMIVYGY